MEQTLTHVTWISLAARKGTILNQSIPNFIIFKNKQHNKADLYFKIEIDNKHIEKVEVTNFLGILIYNNLSWKAHNNHNKIVSKM